MKITLKIFIFKKENPSRDHHIRLYTFIHYENMISSTFLIIYTQIMRAFITRIFAMIDVVAFLGAVDVFIIKFDV